jgi:hypothetical protein
MSADELWAAVSLTDGRRIADPFRPTAKLVGLLEFRVAQLNHAGRRLGKRSRRWPRAEAVRPRC